MSSPSTPDFRAVFEQIPGASLLLAADESFTIVAVSDGYLHATRTRREELVGRSLLALPGGLELRDSLETARQSGVPDTMPLLRHDLPSPEGGFEVRYWSPVNTPIRSPNGEVSFLLHQVQDVTALVSRERQRDDANERSARAATRTHQVELELIRRGQELQAVNERLLEALRKRDSSIEEATRELARHSAVLEAVIQSIPDAVYVGDATGIRQANRAAVEMLGFESLESLNRNVASLNQRLQNRDAASGRILAPEEEPFMRAFHGETVIQEVLSRNLQTCAEVVVRCAAAPVRVNGKIVASVAVNTDITEKNQLAAELQAAAEFRERFLGIVSHDLRNPLSSIYLSANVLLRSETFPEQHLKSVRRIVASAERMQRMIADLLDFTRGRLGGGIPLNRVPADLRGLAQQVVEELETTAEDRPMALQVEGDLQGVWDVDRLAQLLGNLVRNALDYSPAGSPVTLRLEGEEERVSLSVHNTGAPIPPDRLPRIFEPFRRASDASQRSSGLGLGLFIVHEIARAHGGTVEVRSTRAEGTTFTVILPRAAPAPRNP